MYAVSRHFPWHWFDWPLNSKRKFWGDHSVCPCMVAKLCRLISFTGPCYRKVPESVLSVLLSITIVHGVLHTEKLSLTISSRNNLVFLYQISHRYSEQRLRMTKSLFLHHDKIIGYDYILEITQERTFGYFKLCMKSDNINRRTVSIDRGLEDCLGTTIWSANKISKSSRSENPVTYR